MGDPGSGAFDAGSGGFFGGGGGVGDFGDASLPPEREVDLAFEAPQAGLTSVYVPNAATHRVAIVNAKTFQVETVSSGLAPTYSAVVPGEDVAVVLNVGSEDASILRTTAGKTSVIRVPVGHDQNAIAIAPGGAHAVVYFDARLGSSSARSFQDVSVLSLVAGKETARGVTVGFRPRSVQFTDDGAEAFVVTEDGISVIDLRAADAGPSIARLVALGDTLSGATSVDVRVSSDGSYAIARRDGDSSLRLFDLATGATQTLSFEALQAPVPSLVDGGVDGGPEDGGASDPERPLPPGHLELTDLDVAPDGTFALVVVRNASALLRIPIPAGFSDPSLVAVQLIPDVLIGSAVVSKNGAVAALYTTALPIPALVLVDLVEPGAPRTVRLRKPVRAVALSDTGSHAFVLHTKSAALPGESADEALITASDGYSLVDVARGFPKLQLTPATVRESDVFITPDATRVFTLLRDDPAGVRSVQMADLLSFQINTLALAKPPSSIGLVPDAGRVFVGHESEGGMITFLDGASGDVVQSVSGFELSGRVRQ